MLKSQWHMVQGQIGSGKTRVFTKIMSFAKKSKIPLFGFIQPKILGPGGVTEGYNVVLLSDKKKSLHRFVHPNPSYSPHELMWIFEQDVLQKTKDFFASYIIPSQPSLLIFDEYGRLETKGEGQWPNIAALIKRFQSQNMSTQILFSCRQKTENFLRKQMKELGYSHEHSHLTLPTSYKEEQQFIKQIINEILKKNQV